MKRDGWKRATLTGKQVTYTSHERSPQSGDITAQVEGQENFHVHLDVAFPITRVEVETRFAAELLENS
jgi:hypothetical protein